MLYGEFEVDSYFKSDYSVKKYLKPEETNPGFVSRPFGNMYWSGDEWDMLRGHLRRLLGQSPLSHDLNDSNATDDDDSTDSELMRLVICCSTPFNPDQFPEESTEEVTISMKIKLISNLPVNTSRSNKEQSYLAKLAGFCGPENLRWEISELGFGNNVEDAFFKYKGNLAWTWSEDDLAWEAITQMTFENAETMKSYFGDYSWNVYVHGLWVYLEEPGINKVLGQVYSKRGMDVTELREMLEEGRFSDLTITSTNEGGGNKKEIRAHRVVLSAASPHFALMLKNPLKEAETGIVQLPMSEEAIAAMVHFIYYGGTERILEATGDVALELLMAGEIYMVKDLVEVTGLVFHAKIDSWPWRWFSVDAALKLFCFARNLDGQLWKDLMKKAVKFLERKELNQLKTSEGYLKLYLIAVRLGPVFESVFAMSSNKKAATFPQVPEGMPKEEVELVYDFCSATSAGGHWPRSLEIAVGMLVLADFCGREIPNFHNGDLSMYIELEEYSAEFLVELFNKARLRENRTWQNIKTVAVRKLKKLLTEQPNEIMTCAQYKEMLSYNPEAAVEFTRLTAST